MYFEIPNCTVGTDISSMGNMLYYEMPNCTSVTTDISSMGNIKCILKCLTVQLVQQIAQV